MYSFRCAKLLRGPRARRQGEPLSPSDGAREWSGKLSRVVYPRDLSFLRLCVQPRRLELLEAAARRGAIGGLLLASMIAAPAAPALASTNLDRPAPAKARAIPVGPYEPTWDSLREHYRAPQWFLEARFGIFIHWGLYAIPAYHNEWYAKHMYATFAQWHTEHYGPPDKFGYKDFIPFFKADKYDPGQWAELFRKAGARYVVPVAEHHDGFAMYDSALTRWCAGKMGPKRDLLGELATAVRQQGLVFGLSSHRMEHHTFMYPASGVRSDQFEPAYADFYGPPVPGQMNDGNASPEFQEDWLARCQELVDKYRPQLVYFDNGVNHRAYDDVKLRFAAYYYNRAAEWGLEASIATKDDAYLAGSILDFEKAMRGPKEALAGAWQVDDQIGNSWGYVNDMRYRTSGAVLQELATVASRGGNLLLNISPRADGTIPEDQQQILLEVGRWLGTNSEAIYGTHAWARSLDGKVCFTAGTNALYAICLSWPGANLTLKSLARSAALEGKVEGVSLLGNTNAIAFSYEDAGLKLTLPAEAPGLTPAVLKITGLKMNAPGTRVPGRKGSR